jgi:C4-type Zn-finger protein
MEVSTEAQVHCPFCGEKEAVELVSPHGGQLITAHWHCKACNTYFEAIREDFDAG